MEEVKMNKILILISSYLPGYRCGGPQRTIENLCETFKDSVEIYILTLNHDHGVTECYDLPTKKWISRDGIKVMYVTDSNMQIKLLHEMYKDFDRILLCSLFYINVIKMLVVNRIFFRNNVELYVAPMGVLEEGAFGSKTFKKKCFITFGKLSGIFSNIKWSFSSEKEKESAIKILGSKYVDKYVIAEDLPGKIDFDIIASHYIKRSNRLLKIVFISRIVPHKNLILCPDILRNCNKNIQFDIYGVIEDSDYWEECRLLLEDLPNNISYEYKGALLPEEVSKVFSNYDFFLFPTKGENYGHVIYEALSAGCLPIISDKTIWNDLELKKSGAVCSLEDINSFSEAINMFADMEDNQFYNYKSNAIKYAEEKYKTSCNNSGYKVILGLERM